MEKLFGVAQSCLPIGSRACRHSYASTTCLVPREVSGDDRTVSDMVPASTYNWPPTESVQATISDFKPDGAHQVSPTRRSGGVLREDFMKEVAP